MATVDAFNSKKKIKQISFAFASSFIVLLTFFLLTMLTHTNGQIDLSYLLYAIPRIAVLSIGPVGVVIFAKVSKWYWSVACGIIVGFILAALYVNFS